MTSVVLGLSILAQAAAAVLALRLNWLHGRQWAWKLISLAIVLMTIRRCVTLIRLVASQPASVSWMEESDTFMASAMLSLVVSILLVVGVALIDPIFRRVKQVESVLAGKADQLQQIVAMNDAEFQIARKVQQQLYPDKDPDIEGFDISGRSIPARSASGDYFDYLKATEGTIIVVIGDASGHGMGAALLATEARAFLHAACKSHEVPGEVLTMVNSFLCNDTTGGQFVTFSIARIDVSRRELVAATAGHPMFLLNESGEFEIWNSDGIPLGINSDVTYTTTPPRRLLSGDILVLCSDGLWEAHGPDGSQFGTERVLDIINKHRQRPSREIVAMLFESVEKFTGCNIPDDDVTVLIVKAM